ncbi:MAG TPA: aminoacyl-tRNA hydrolase [Anaerolineae bacterium]|nr:aminoacyl-tRNA hydrolase [Anaerolineae bacterium]HID83970.1 aminoacyl-tRNA hydrolase [Anaerolineales bacterium]HIQ09262.1 aminoacyl-tRNA hydrolase [Anaerolineaceae bacterium]
MTFAVNLPHYLIVGLGNPGRQYARNRHNVGFLVVSRLAERLGAPFGRMQHKALIAQGRHERRRLILAKPQTFMNLAGQAVAPLLRFYKIPLDHLLVVYDDLDLPPFTLRLRPKGGHGGHKGMRDIIQRLGSQEFPRLRVGIGRPPGRMDAADYVLQDFSPAEQETLAMVLDRAVEGILLWISEGLPAAMNFINRPEETP